MTALSDNRQTDRQDGALLALPMGDDIVYQGSLVCNNASGYAVAGADTASFVFLGVAYEKVDNAGGANGAKDVRVHRRGIFSFAGSGFAITDVGAYVYVVDDQTVGLAATTTNDVKCGKIVKFVSATEVWIDIEAAVAA